MDLICKSYAKMVRYAESVVASLFFFFVFFHFTSVKADPMFGDRQLFVDGWKFIQPASVDDDILKITDFSKWQTVVLPHDWSVKGCYSPDKYSATGYLPGGMGWYAKEFVVPAEKKGEKIYIYFEGIYNRSTVYLNGKLVGNRPNGYMSTLYDLTPYIRYGENNVLKVTVDHTRENDSRWYTGSGIYRDVYLVYANPVHVDLWGIFFHADKVTSRKADVAVETTLRNFSSKQAKVKLVQTIYDVDGGKVVTESSKSVSLDAGDSLTQIQKMSIARPKLWSISSPQLYTLKTTVYVDGKKTEENSRKVGIRTLTFDPNNGFALNGTWMKLKGVCIHHDAGCLGSAVPVEVWRRRLQTLKEIGCNAIRMSHNPQAPVLYDLCDELGFVVMDEAFDEWEYPKRKWVSGWNVGTPGFQGSADFFNEWCERDVRDMVLRDRNHASIIMWSIGNEVDYPNDPYSHPVLDHGRINQPMYGGYKKDAPNAERLGEISKRLATTVKKYDTTRPVTAALAGVIMSNETDYPFNLDICGYNYTENRYDEDHSKYPDRVIYGSENGQGLDAWKKVRDSKNIFAQFIWTGIDYLGEAGRWPSRGLYTGLIDLGGFIKPRGYFRRALWSEKPVAYLGTYPAHGNHLSQDAWTGWNYDEGQNVRVVAYCNTPKSRLLLNGKVVGEEKSLDDNTFITSWDIPFAPGKLEVEGLDKDGKVVASYSVSTSKRPHAITAEVVEGKIIDKNRGVAQIILQVVDEDGNPVYISDDEITCNIEGPMKLLGLESGNNSDMGNYNDNRQRAFHGHLIAYVQATGQDGTAKIKFSAPWLKGTTVELQLSNNRP